MTTLEAPICWGCVVGLHEECLSPQLVDDGDTETAPELRDVWVKCCCFSSKVPDASTFANGVGRPVAEPADITDILSTGRKRAQMLYPIFEDMLCEWAGLARAGGGTHPIVGCRGNRIDPTKEGPRAGHRHHGPNKNVIDNGPSNVHRICTTCHNRWHALNNASYAQPRPPADQPWYPEGDWQKHDPETLATEEDYEEDAAFWAGRRIEKVDTED